MHKLRVLYQSGVIMEYPNPESHTCFSIGECDDWHPAKMISWFALPTNRFAMFFETDNCYSGEGYFVYITEQGDVDGSHAFENVQPIRSMMLGVTQDALDSQKFGSDTIDRGCWSTKIISGAIVPHLYEGTPVAMNKTTRDAEVEWVVGGDSTGGLSSNWSDALPEAAEGSVNG
ncbi:NEDD8-specific protease 1 [Phytophthora cinnamomi]|uniref:NEDD8-specific protease 1 n=1 Tax=Phytophthora cinnamomi TaxID=4785 RepID=UPI0035598005|nr:NEDD8-specific protease 1 [Phytophthora cinnamomi]